VIIDSSLIGLYGITAYYAIKGVVSR